MWNIIARSLASRPLPVAAPPLEETQLAELGKRLDEAARARLGRSLAIREVDAGSCNACELEIQALNNAFYDLERFGLRFVASPRHADVLLVTGPVTTNMREALERTHRATPDPKWVVAVGDCARDGGLFAYGSARFHGRQRRLDLCARPEQMQNPRPEHRARHEKANRHGDHCRECLRHAAPA